VDRYTKTSDLQGFFAFVAYSRDVHFLQSSCCQSGIYIMLCHVGFLVGGKFVCSFLCVLFGGWLFCYAVLVS
jgi:hypothetical protein